MKHNLSVLGSTGSIGTQTLDVAEKLGLNVRALTANSNIDLLEKQIRKFKPELAVVFREDKAAELRDNIKDTSTKVLAGMDGLIAAATLDSADLVLNSVVGMVGLQPTIAAAEAKKDIALANKETLVAGGDLVTDAVRRNGIRLLPVDSEHSAIFQCLQGNKRAQLKKIILTASGGPFFGKTRDELKNVTVENALNHPNWAMGAKITVDSATMMNKGLELIEAVWLFKVKPEDIDIVVHRESIVHSAVEYDDNSVIAQLGVPDMRIPIQYALTYPERFESPVEELNLAQIGKLTFYNPDYSTFSCINLCKKAISMGGLMPAAVNSANEQANLMFRKGEIGFLEIAERVERVFGRVPEYTDYTLDDVMEIDALSREIVRGD